MNFKLFGKTMFVVNIKFELFLAIHSASELPIFDNHVAMSSIYFDNELPLKDFVSASCVAWSQGQHMPRGQGLTWTEEAG